MLSPALFPSVAWQTMFSGTCYQLLSLLCVFQIQLAGISSSILFIGVQKGETVPSVPLSLPLPLFPRLPSATEWKKKLGDSFEHLSGRTKSRDLNSYF